MFKCFRRTYYRWLEILLINKIARGHAIVDYDKEILKRDVVRLSTAYGDLRQVRARLAMIEPAGALIDEAMRRA